MHIYVGARKACSTADQVQRCRIKNEINPKILSNLCRLASAVPTKDASKKIPEIEF